MAEDNDLPGLADDQTINDAQAELSRAVAEIEDKYGLILPDLVEILIHTAVAGAFDIWEEKGPEDAKRLIQDTVAACLNVESEKRGY